MEASKMFVLTTCCAVLFSSIPGAVSRASAQQSAAVEESSSRDTAVNPQSSPEVSELPDSPGATLSKPGTTGSDDSSQSLSSQFLAKAVAPQDEPQQERATQSQSPTGPQSVPEKPVGTAAAGAIPASGIAASQPAGVAIAPAKQHRVRTIVLRMGAIIGAGVAVGSVVALTEATPSKPPGAH